MRKLKRSLIVIPILSWSMAAFGQTIPLSRDYMTERWADDRQCRAGFIFFSGGMLYSELDGRTAKWSLEIDPKRSDFGWVTLTHTEGKALRMRVGTVNPKTALLTNHAGILSGLYRCPFELRPIARDGSRDALIGRWARTIACDDVMQFEPRRVVSEAGGSGTWSYASGRLNLSYGKAAQKLRVYWLDRNHIGMTDGQGAVSGYRRCPGR
ncbi:hypothetical protein OK349_17685 [Sphingomonas sp. BT-65]|uniref:hypothetical protein n=1 Tax=Sphingomonas sp. BT-65 TaxID=2989821 RepID=UPI0022354676|nr:hypothetical protein [Sphingomonas sp. BT-65]MCW4463542.1 hypothetical protein [Sphingomonas sp. BT-65]